MSTAEARASFEGFVAGRSAALGRLAFFLTGQPQDAEDLLQAALIRVAARWHTLDDPEAYVRRVIYTQAISRWRWLRRRPPEVLTSEMPDSAVAEFDLDTRVVLDQALRRLTVKQRAVLVLRFYEDQSESQTATALGCSIGTVKSQTRHALARLRELNPQLAQLLADRPAQKVAAS